MIKNECSMNIAIIVSTFASTILDTKVVETLQAAAIEAFEALSVQEVLKKQLYDRDVQGLQYRACIWGVLEP